MAIMKCGECKGSGKIVLLTSSKTCNACKGKGTTGEDYQHDIVQHIQYQYQVVSVGAGNVIQPASIICSPPYGGSLGQCQRTGCTAKATVVADSLSPHPINFCTYHYNEWANALGTIP